MVDNRWYMSHLGKILPQVQSYLERHYSDGEAWIGFPESKDKYDVSDSNDPVIHIDFDGDQKSDGFIHVSHEGYLYFRDARQFAIPFEDWNVPFFNKELPIDLPSLDDTQGRITEIMMSLNLKSSRVLEVLKQLTELFPDVKFTVLTHHSSLFSVVETLFFGSQVYFVHREPGQTVKKDYVWIQDRLLPTDVEAVTLMKRSSVGDDVRYKDALVKGGQFLVDFNHANLLTDGASILSSQDYVFMTSLGEENPRTDFKFQDMISGGREVIQLFKPYHVAHIDMVYAPSNVKIKGKEVLFVGDYYISSDLSEEDHPQIWKDKRKLDKQAQELESKFHIVRIPLPVFETNRENVPDHQAYYVHSYLNLLMEDTGDQRRVILPHFNSPYLERNVEFIFRKYGYDVNWVRGMEKMAPYGGAVRCLTQVLSRESN